MDTIPSTDLSDNAFAATAKPPRMTPWQKKEDRLVRQLAKTSGEIEAAEDKYRAGMLDHIRRMSEEDGAASDAAKVAQAHLIDISSRCSSTYWEIDEVERELVVLRARLDELRDAQVEAESASEAAQAALSVVRNKWAGTKPPEGSAHLAALHKDRDAVVYRLQQHRARMAAAGT